VGYFKSKEFGIETPEPSDSPAITSDLKKFAEQVDALLRKQLTKLFEVAKLKVTETVELPAESLTTTMLKALAVTAAKLGSEAVTEAKIANEAVTEAKLAKALQIGAWTNPESLGAKCEVGGIGGGGELQVRLESGGTVLRVRGSARVRSGQTLKSGEVIMTLPAAGGFRPAFECGAVVQYYSGAAEENVGALPLSITKGGLVEINTSEATTLSAGNIMFLEFTIPLT
jgi:hypothetical protein